MGQSVETISVPSLFGTVVCNPDGTDIGSGGAGSTQISFDLNGTLTDVSMDTVTPANSRPLPVEILNASGITADFTGADINVQLNAGGTQPDSVRIGDGTNELSINADGSINVNTGGGTKSKVDLIRNDYSSVNITTGAYVQLIASTSADIEVIDVFDSSGQTLVFAVGGAGSEVNQFYIVPGGNGTIELDIPSGSRLSAKAISADATSGELVINCFN